MSSPQVLIVDDESSIRFILERTLRGEAYQVETAADGEEALGKLRKNRYDLMLLDLHMPGISGLQVLRTANELDPDLVVIILTAHGSLESAVEALRLGAFDYLFKPATPSAIRQRVAEGYRKRIKTLQQRKLLENVENLRTLLGEIETLPNHQILTTDTRFLKFGSLILDKHHRTVSLAGQEIELTTTEFDILACLVMAAPEPLSPRALLNCAMGYDGAESEAREIIKWHIHHLRQKIEPEPSQPTHIRTVRFKGYMWSGET